uniref:CUB and sushi domain-containing protein 3 n=1 Tax=Hirondellea gigas TaxID=1518452 RepID=A0A6A7G4S0_9CRUS
MITHWIIMSAVVATGLACGFPGAPAHSTVTFSDESVSEGTVATYKCDRGFELLGPARKICMNNGTWSPPGIPFCVLNVAAGKAPMQSSVADGGIPQKAVDGSTATAYTPGTCSLTETESAPWWYVNLLEPYMVQLVRLDFGQDCCGDREATIVVRVGNNRPDLGVNPVCNKFRGKLQEGRPLFLPCNPPMPGAFVSVHFEGPPGVQLSICEAFVYTDQALPIERCPSFRGQPLGSTATYNGKCYIFYNDLALNFDKALETCRDRGGSLIDETNPALQGFLSWELWMRHRGDVKGQYWMGAVRDPEDLSNWKWINGNDVSVSFWNLPGGNENCARFDGTKGWLWADTNCMADLHFMCQHQPLTCGKPEQPPNSTMKPLVYVVGTEVQYTCDPGHVLIGPVSRTCLNSGFFDGVPPICRYIQCGHPAPIRHGRYHLVNDTRDYGSYVQYTCDPGYSSVDRTFIMCDDDKRWDGRPPRCIRTDAAKPSLADDFLDLDRSPPPYEDNRVDDSVADSSNNRPGTVIPAEQDDASNDDLINNRANIVNSPDYKGAGPAIEMGPKMQTGGIIALGVFGGVVLLSAVVTTIVIIVKRSQSSSSKKYMRRHDDVTTSSDASSSDGNGMNKYYKRAWDNLRDSSDAIPGRDPEKAHHSRRGDSGDAGVSGTADLRSTTRSGATHEGMRDGSEMTVNDVTAMYTRPEKRRHHHHHHSHRHQRGGGGGGGGGGDHYDHDHHDRHDSRDWRDRDRRKY